MTNLRITSRTNYVAIRDEKKASFKAYYELFGHSVFEEKGRFTIMADEDDDLFTDLSPFALEEAFDEAKKGDDDAREKLAWIRHWLPSVEIDNDIDDVAGAIDALVEMDVRFCAATVAKMMEADEVLVTMTVGNEKLRSLFGHATAHNHAGASVEIGLDSIYGKAVNAFGIAKKFR